MVFEYMDHDLTGVLQSNCVHYEAAHIKCLLKQLFDGLGYLHSRQIIHRDVKGNSCLILLFFYSLLDSFYFALLHFIPRKQLFDGLGTEVLASVSSLRLAALTREANHSS